jgi:hypothetical protein
MALSLSMPLLAAMMSNRELVPYNVRETYLPSNTSCPIDEHERFDTKATGKDRLLDLHHLL